MGLDFSILRCNPIVVPVREKRLEGNKKATVFQFLRAVVSSQRCRAQLRNCLLQSPLSCFRPGMSACLYLEITQGTHWCAETRWLLWGDFIQQLQYQRSKAKQKALG